MVSQREWTMWMWCSRDCSTLPTALSAIRPTKIRHDLESSNILARNCQRRRLIRRRRSPPSWGALGTCNCRCGKICAKHKSLCMSHTVRFYFESECAHPPLTDQEESKAWQNMYPWVLYLFVINWLMRLVLVLYLWSSYVWRATSGVTESIRIASLDFFFYFWPCMPCKLVCR